MNRSVIRWCMSVICAVLVAVSSAGAQNNTSGNPTYKLTIHITGFRNQNGLAGTLVFCTPKGWPESNGDACRHGSVPIQNGQATVTYDGLKAGRYAIVALHDENKNKKMDRNFIGIPKEGFGFPNGIKVNLRPPTWDAASVNVNGDTTVEIKLQYK